MLWIVKTEQVALNGQICVYFRLSTKMSELGDVEFLFCFKTSKDYLNYTEIVLFGD